MAFGSPATVPQWWNLFAGSIESSCEWVCVCVCVCVFWCILTIFFDVIFFLIWDLLGRFWTIVGAFWAPFWEVLAPRAVSGPPLGRSRVPLGPRLTPTEVQGAKSWFVGPPPGFPNEVILASIFIDFSNKKGIGFRLDYGNNFKWKMMPKCLQKPLKIH